VAGLEAEAEGWGQNKKTLVREAESYEVQLTDLLLVCNRQSYTYPSDRARVGATQAGRDTVRIQSLSIILGIIQIALSSSYS
jgi:hypothetical protein